MMPFQRFLALAALALLSGSLISCGTSSGPIQATNPTIQQMDNLDVQWGLPKRVSRSNASPAKRFISSDSGSSNSSRSESSASAPAPAPAQQTVDPSVIQGLR